jgi:hypothetical protein
MFGPLDAQQYPPASGPLQYLGSAASGFVERHLPCRRKLQEQQSFLKLVHFLSSLGRWDHKVLSPSRARAQSINDSS